MPPPALGPLPLAACRLTGSFLLTSNVALIAAWSEGNSVLSCAAGCRPCTSAASTLQRRRQSKPGILKVNEQSHGQTNALSLQTQRVARGDLKLLNTGHVMVARMHACHVCAACSGGGEQRRGCFAEL